MIAPLQADLGSPIELKGYAQNFDAPVRAVQFSCDEGKTWSTFETPGAAASLNVNWRFSFTPPAPGSYRVLIRALSADGAVTPEAAVVPIVVREAA